MKLNILTLLALIVAITAAIAAQEGGAAPATVPSYRSLCAVGPIRCQSLLRTDLSVAGSAPNGVAGR
jgi:hypothetical protein